MQEPGGTSGRTGSGISGSIRSLNKITTFSPFTFGSTSSNNPLPTELTHFDTFNAYSTIYLEWSTVSEVKNDFFTIEIGSNLNDQRAVSSVNGSGNSSTVIDYSFVDKSPLRGISYYRLTQTDDDGKSTYSKIVSLDLELSNEQPFRIFPNPTREKIRFIENEPDLKQALLFDNQRYN